MIGCTFVSCTSEVKYEAPEFAEMQPKEIRVLNDEYLFRYGETPMLVDSLLIVSTMNPDNYIAVFNSRTGQLLKEFARKGPGPEEMVTPTAYSVDKLNRLLYVCDLGKRNMFCYNLKTLLEGGAPKPEFIKITDDLAKRANVRFLKDSLFYAPAFKDARFLIGREGVRTVVKSEIPDASKFPMLEDWFNYMNANAATTVRPDGRYLAAASSLGGILEIFDLNSKNMKRVALKLFYEPIFKQKGHVFFPVPETIGGFMCLSATDKYLYATLHGKANPTSMPTFICKFDWRGNPIARYDCGKYPITSFTVSEDDRMVYAVAIGDEMEQILLEIKL